MNRKLLLFLLLSLCTVWAHATDFTYYGYGNWSNQASWTPYYPGTHIGASDRVTMSGSASTSYGDNIIIDGSLTGYVRINVSGGSFTINGTVNTVYFSSYADITIGSAATVSNCDIYMSRGNFTNSGTINNSSLDLWGGLGVNSGVMHLRGASNQYGGTLQNSGSVDVLSGGTWDFNVLNGLTNTGSGSVWFRTGSTLRIFQDQNLSIFHFETGTTLRTRGNPNLTANWTNDAASNFWIGEGDCCGDNRVRFTGNFTNQGSFTADVRGTATGEVASFTGSGAFVAGGKLVINQVNGYTPPAAGFTFTLVTAGSVSGTFSQVVVPAGWVASVTYNNPAGTVRVFVQPVSVSTGALGASALCAGSTISVPFTASGVSTGNVYTAQLSNASGSFASPVAIGTLTSVASSGSISATIPANTASGTGYRIRVVASNPAVTGTDNGSNLSIQVPLPTSIAYTGSPFCASTGSVPVFFSGINGGAFSSSPAGLSLNAATGAIDLGNTQPGIYTVTYTVSGTCALTTTTTVAVRPTLSVVQAPVNQVVCAGTTVSPAIVPVAGLSYTWTNTNAAIGLAASGTGLPGSFTAQTSGTATESGYVRVYAIGGTGCTFSAVALCVRVKPVPVLDAVSSQVLCTGSATADVNFNPNVAGSTVSWTNTNTAIGLTATGTGNIPSFTTLNATGSVQAATLTATPVAAGCSGAAVNFSIQVSPAAGSISYPQASYCPAGNAAVTRHGSPGGVFTATPSGLTIDATTGQVNLALSNEGTYTITYTVGAIGSCSGSASTTLTVLPKASINAIPNQTVCSGMPTSSLAISGSAPSYSWTITDASGALLNATAGSGTTIPSWNTAAFGSGYRDAMVTVTPNGGANLCSGKASSFRIRVTYCAPLAQSGNTGGDAATQRLALAARFEAGPNPARSTVVLRYTGNEAGLFTVQLVSQYGQPIGRVFTMSGNTYSLDLGNVTPGTYSLQVTQVKTGITFNKQVIKL